MTNPINAEFLDRRLDARGVPKGGTEGQALTKATDLDNDVAWSTPTVADGSITASKLAADAVTTPAILNDAVTAAKIAQGTAGQVLMTNATPDTAWTTLSGDVTVNSSGLTAIGAGVIVDNDVAAAAAIAHSKLANITAASVLMGNASNIPTATAISGDVTISAAGAVTIGNDKVTAAKIAQGTAGQVLMTNATPDTAWTTLTGDVTVNSSGLTAISAGAVVKADLAATAGEIAGTWTSATVVTRGNISGVQAATLYSNTIGKTFHFQISMPTGNTATAAGAITFTLPGGITAARNQVLSGRTSAAVGTCTITGGVVTLQATAAGANFTAGQALGTVNIGGTIEIT